MQRERIATTRQLVRHAGSWLVLLSCLSTGCSGAKTPPALPPAPATKTIVKVSSTHGPATDILKRFGPAFEAATGIAVEIKARPLDDAPDSAADLWLIEPAEMPHWAAAGKLAPVPTELMAQESDYFWNNILPVYRSKLLKWGKQELALPLVDQTVLCFYRTDLLADTANQTAFKAKYGRNLGKPATWQDVARIAEFFNGKPRPGLNRPCASLSALPTEDDELDQDVYLTVAPFVRRSIKEDAQQKISLRDLFSFHYDLETGKPLIHTAGFVAGLQMLHQLQAFRAPANADPAKAFADGETVICLAGTGNSVRFQRSPAVKDKFAVARPPGSEVVYGFDNAAPPAATEVNEVPYLGARGTVMVVPASSGNAAAAFKLAAFLSNPKTSRDIVTDPSWGGCVFRDEHLGLNWGSFDLAAGQREELITNLKAIYLHTSISNPLLRLRIPDQVSHRAALLKEVRAALKSVKGPKQALADADKAWRELDSKMTPAERLASYRLSVNLSP